MSYGVTKQWQASHGRARRAAKTSSRSKSRSKRKGSSRSAQRAKKKRSSVQLPRARSARPRKKRASRPRAKKARTPRAKKERTYSRYDPASGRKVKVTADDPRFDEWPSRKPSARKRTAAKIRADPVGYIGKRVQQRIERQVESATARTARRVAPALVGAGRAALGGALAVSAPAVAAGAALTLALGLSAALLKLSGLPLKTGEKVNRISAAFVASQRALMQASGVTVWERVPEDARRKLLAAYRSALQRATQGVVSVGRETGSFK